MSDVSQTQDAYDAHIRIVVARAREQLTSWTLARHLGEPEDLITRWGDAVYAGIDELSKEELVRAVVMGVAMSRQHRTELDRTVRALRPVLSDSRSDQRAFERTLRAAFPLLRGRRHKALHRTPGRLRSVTQ